MITFRLGTMGRMGNAMFQIAACVAHAERVRDVAIFPRWPYAKYFKYPITQGRLSYSSLFVEKEFTFSKLPESRNMCLHGYFQSEKYFKECPKIKEIFQPCSFLDKKTAMDYSGTCSIHVRRGDYVQLSNYHRLLDIEYYLMAMDMMDSRFLLFSDDINWCKQNFGGVEFYHEDQMMDFFTMMKCENHIIANSSFSWWAAWLGGGTVIAPQKWFGEDCKHDTKDLLPESWIKI